MTDATPPSSHPFGPPGQRAPQLPAAARSCSLSFYKIVLIGGLAIATIVPNLFITNLVEERETRQGGVRRSSPATGDRSRTSTARPGDPVPGRRSPAAVLKIAPARLEVAAALNPQERKRGLFHATVYDAKVEMSGAFVVPAEARLRDFPATRTRASLERGGDRIRRASNLTGLRASDTSWSTTREQQWTPCLEAMRDEPPAATPRWCSRTRRLRRRATAARACRSSRW